MKRYIFLLVFFIFYVQLFSANTFVKTIGGTDHDVVYDGFVKGDAYYFFGYTYSFSSTMDGYVIKLSTDGTAITEKSIDLGKDELFRSAVLTPEGDFLVVGYTR